MQIEIIVTQIKVNDYMRKNNWNVKKKTTDKYAFETENKENLELLKLSNSLECACKEK